MDDNKTFLLNRIITGYVPVIFHSKLYKVYDTNIESNYLSDIYIQNIKEDISLYDSTNAEYITTELKRRSLWTDKMQSELDLLEKDQERLLIGISDSKFKSKDKERYIKTLEFNKKRCAELYSQKEYLFAGTIEHLIRLEKLKYLIFLNTYDSYGNRVWEDWDVFDNNTSDNLIKHILLNSYLKYNINESDIRFLVRNDPWRLYWRTATKVGNLFGKPSVMLTDYQRMMVSWSIIYDSVYESLDCPERDVIENDILLDAWLIKQSKKNKSDSDDKISKNDRINNAQEIGIVVQSQEDIDKVYNLNDSSGAKIIADREKALLNKGKLSEMELPDIKQDFQKEINRIGQESIKKRSK